MGACKKFSTIPKERQGRRALGMDIVDSFEGFEVGGEAFDFS